MNTICFSGGSFPAGRCHSHDFGLQSQKNGQEERDGRLVQPRLELQRRRRTGALDGHEGISTATNFAMARFGAVIAYRNFTYRIKE